MSQTAEYMLRSSTASLRGGVSPAEWHARVDLAAAYRFMQLKGWQDDYTIYNHLSARVPGEPRSFLLKPHDLMFGEVTASSLIKVPMDGPDLGFKENVNPAAWVIHGSVLRARPDVHAVMHLHTVPGMAVCALDRDLLFVHPISMMFYNRIAYHPFEGVTEVEEGPQLVRNLGANNKAMILRNHGLLTCGSSIGSAVNMMATLIRLCELQLAVLSSGEKTLQPSAEVCERTAQIFDRTEKSKGSGAEWAAILRWLEKHDHHDTSFRD